MEKKVTKLIKKRNKRLQSLPPLKEVVRGTVFKRQIKCGKQYCHCAEGKGHTVWYLSSTHPSGKTEQISLKRTQVPAVRAWVKNYRKAKKILEAVSAINRDIIRERRTQIKGKGRKQ